MLDIASDYEVIILDQWGVLHNGSKPYPGAVHAMNALSKAGLRLAILSNSGKRAGVNAKRIVALGLPMENVEITMTSGEAFWRDCKTGAVDPGRMYPITGSPNDADNWSDGLPVRWAASLDEANSVLLMGLPEGSDGARETETLEGAAARDLPVFCTNPDRASPRADGSIQISPGALGHAYQDQGGDVRFYGKPHRPIYDALLGALDVGPKQCLMVGDSLEHDVAGAQSVGMASAFVIAGLHADTFARSTNPEATACNMATRIGLSSPEHVIERLS